MSTATLAPVGLRSTAAPLRRPAAWTRWWRPFARAWKGWRLARARAALLRRADALQASAPGYAADLRRAALDADGS